MGFREWTDSFDIENIPSTLFDKAFHINVGPVSPEGGISQSDIRFSVEARVQFCFKAFRNIAQGIDDAYLALDDILDGILDPAFRLSNTGVFKELQPTSAEVFEFSADNDNLVILEVTFGVTVFKCF